MARGDAAAVAAAEGLGACREMIFEEKRKNLKKNPIVECNKIQNKYYSDLFSRFVEVNDPRNQSYIDYTVKVMLGVLYYKCIGGISSMQELKIRRSISIRVKKK